MDEFILQIDETKFRSTNGPWNNLCLNDPWSVGYVSTLIELKYSPLKNNGNNFIMEVDKKEN